MPSSQSTAHSAQTVVLWECDRCRQRFLHRPHWGTHWTPANWVPRLYCHGELIQRIATLSGALDGEQS